MPKPAMCIFYRFSTTRFERLSMPFLLPSKGDRWRPRPRHVHGPGRPGRAHHRTAHLRPHSHPHRRSRLPALRPHGALHGPQRGMSCSCDAKKLVPPVILSQERNGEYFLPLNVNRYQAWGGEQVCGVDCEEERSEAVLVPFFCLFYRCLLDGFCSRCQLVRTPLAVVLIVLYILFERWDSWLR